MFAAVAALSLGSVLWLALLPDEADELATAAGLFIGLASLLLSLLDFFRQEPVRPDPAALADDLALRLREQWLEEAQARRLRDPRVLPLKWTATTREVVDRSGASDAARARVLRMRLDGRLDGRFDEVIDRLAANYARIPNRRLVTIGEPGAGKTVLAILLTLGLLGARDQGGPVPVLLPVASWDPVRERLDDWIVRTLAQPYYNGREDIPRTLLTQGLLLPVLDGLDEIPESARRSAIRGINHAIGGDRPIVVTCRATEYEELIRGGAPTLRRAAVVEVAPVPVADVIGYLREVDWPTGVDWEPVFTHLRADPAGPVADVLSTPLMVTSARLVYRRGGADPGELLDRERFDCAYAVEDHLTHGLVDAAYAPDPDAPEGEGPAPGDRWTADQARRWLTFLACYLHDRRERDLAWWLLSGRLLSRWAGPVSGLGLGALIVLGVFVAAGSIGVENEAAVLTTVLAASLAFALFNTLVWYASGDRPPGRLAWSVRGSAGRLRRGFRGGVTLALVSVVPLFLGITAVRMTSESGGWRTPRVTELCVEAVTVSTGFAAVVGLALAAHNWLDAPPSRATQVSPGRSLAQDRRSALVSALIAGLVVTATGLPAWYMGVVSGDFLLGLLTGWTGWPGRSDLSMLSVDRFHDLVGPADKWYALERVAVLPLGAFFALLVLMSRAWPRFVLARIYLAVRGHLPWRLMAFLADARRRELLRQSGGVYQFRHIRLQEALAGQPMYSDEDRTEELARRAVRRRVVLAAGAGLVAAGAGWTLTRRQDVSAAVLAVSEGSSATSVAFRPGSGSEVAVGLGGDAVLLWKGRNEDRSVTPVRMPTDRADHYNADYYHNVLAFPADGRFLAMSGQDRVEILDLARDRTTVARLGVGTTEETGEPDWADRIAFHRRRGFLACTGLATSRIWVWEAADEDQYSLDPVRNFPYPSDRSITGMVFLADGGLAVVDDNGRTRVWSPPNFDVPRRLLPASSLWDSDTVDGPGPGTGITVSGHDGSIALFGPGGGELWRREGTGWGSSPWPLGQVSAGQFHPAKPLLAVAGFFGGDVELWQTTGLSGPRRLRTLTGHNQRVTAMDISLDGNWLATAAQDRTVRIWDLSRA